MKSSQGKSSQGKSSQGTSRYVKVSQVTLPACIRRMISMSRSDRTTSRSLYISKMVRCDNDHHDV